MKASKRTARIAGALFLTAMVTSLVGGVWLESMTAVPDYLSTLSDNQVPVVIGVLLELVNCAAVVGIAAALYPVLKGQSEALAVGYAGIRVVEAVVLSLAAIGPLLLVSLSQAYVMAGTGDASNTQALGTLVMDVRAQIAGLLTPVFFGLGALLLYGSFYQTKLVPRFISVWGLIGVASMLTWNLVNAFGLTLGAAMVFGLPIILNEIFLGIWLIVRGFNAPDTAGATGEVDSSTRLAGLA
ncbi:MAG: DUF4386 domain-containing protein [Anaerolineae bacterium]